jgi:hypothetical protein
LLHVLERRAIQDLAAREPDVVQRLLELIRLDLLVALDLEGADRRPLLHDDYEHARLFPPQLDIAEEAAVVHRAQRLANAARIEPVADVHRQPVEQRAFGDALQAFDADVGDFEVVAGGARGSANYHRGEQRRRDAPWSFSLHPGV